MTTWPSTVRRAAVLAAAAGAAVALCGCATSNPGSPASTSTSTSTTTRDNTLAAPTTGSPRQRATQDAAHIVTSFPAPPGATRSGRTTSPLLSAPTEDPATPDLVMVTQWWTAAGQPEAVLAWVRAHLPAGFSLTGSGSGGTGSSGQVKPGQAPARPAVQNPYRWFDEFSLPATDVLTQRSLVVTVTAHGRSATAIRVDAQVIWLPAKSATERIPSNVRVVTVTPEFNGPSAAPGAGRDHAFTVTSPARVAAIAAAVDRLPVYPPGMRSCGPNANVEMRLVFRASARGPVVAVVDTNGYCAAVSVTIDGRTMPALSDFTRALAPAVLAIAGVNWPYNPDW